MMRPHGRFIRSTTPLPVSDTPTPLRSVYCEKDLHSRRNRHGRIQEDLWLPPASWNETVTFIKGRGRIDPKCFATIGAARSHREGSARWPTTHDQRPSRNGYASRPVSKLKRVNDLRTALNCCVVALFHHLRCRRLGDAVKINSVFLKVYSAFAPSSPPL